jgi:hypothetical protein
MEQAMNGRFSHEANIARVGVSLAQMYIAETISISDVDARIEMLQLSITNAKTDMSPFLAEVFYVLAQLAPHASDEQVKLEMEKADIIGSPHRMCDVLSKESMQAVAHWVDKSGGHAGPAMCREKSKNTLLFNTLAVEYVLRNDVITSPIMKSVDLRQKAIARRSVWGRELVERIDRLENLVPADEEQERSNTIQKWKLMFVLRDALDKDNVPRSKYLSKEDDVVLTKRWKSISVLEIAQAFSKILTRAQVASVIIDSGICELHTRIFIHTLSEKIEQLTAQRDNTTPKYTAQEESSLLTIEDFADFLFGKLNEHRLIHECTKNDIRYICQANGSRGCLSLRVPKRDVYWCATIAYKIAFLLDRGTPKFSVKNGRRALKGESMFRALNRPRSTEMKCPKNVAAFLDQLSTVRLQQPSPEHQKPEST